MSHTRAKRLGALVLHDGANYIPNLRDAAKYRARLNRRTITSLLKDTRAT